MSQYMFVSIIKYVGLCLCVFLARDLFQRVCTISLATTGSELNFKQYYYYLYDGYKKLIDIILIIWLPSKQNRKAR
jgi:hypothetical protein